MLLTSLLSGSVLVKSTVSQMTPTGVQFTDGTHVDNVDAVICATGQLPLEPSAAADRRIRRPIFIRRKSAEKYAPNSPPYSASWISAIKINGTLKNTRHVLQTYLPDRTETALSVVTAHTNITHQQNFSSERKRFYYTNALPRHLLATAFRLLYFLFYNV